MAKYHNTYQCYGLAIKDELQISTEGLFIGIRCLLLFIVGVLSNAYSVLEQTRLFGRDVP